MPSVYYQDIRTTFSRICPDLRHDGKASTRTTQRHRLDPPGLTIVAFINNGHDKPFKKAIEKIETSSGKRFCSTSFLHFTLLGLFNDERKCPDSPDEKDEIIKSAKEFIEQKHFGHLTINFNLVRLGAFYKAGSPCDGDGDGTLVATADREFQEVNKLNSFGNDLACHMRKTFPIFCNNNKLKREHPTVWSTLGYFDEPDFDIDERLASILENLKSFNATVSVSQLEVRSYGLRSLEISDLKTTINL
jgi:hypothetical protein